MPEMLDEVRDQILWFESLLDCIDDGDIEIAQETIKAAIKLLRKKLQ